MKINDYLAKFISKKKSTAIIWRNKHYSFEWLYERINQGVIELETEGITCGNIVTLETDSSPVAVAIFFALIKKSCIIAPVSCSSERSKINIRKVVEAEFIVSIDEKEDLEVLNQARDSSNELYQELKSNQQSGLVLFTTGTTGSGKAVLHNFNKLLDTFKDDRKPSRHLILLLFDHIGGVQTLFDCLAKGCSIVFPLEKSINSTCESIDKHKIEVLHSTPSFLNLLFLNNSKSNYNFNSLKLITFGAEVMPEPTYNKILKQFPNIILYQQYGSTELGILKLSQSKDKKLFLEFDEKKYETNVKDEILYIRTSYSMIGYLNSCSPFDVDGWYNTGDIVEKDGKNFKFLGRGHDIINVGGKKVLPNEVEEIILTMNTVDDVLIYKEKNEILGEIICATIKPLVKCDKKKFICSVKDHCFKHLENHQVPIKYFITFEPILNLTQTKKNRRVD